MIATYRYNITLYTVTSFLRKLLNSQCILITLYSEINHVTFSSASHSLSILPEIIFRSTLKICYCNYSVLPYIFKWLSKRKDVQVSIRFNQQENHFLHFSSMVAKYQPHCRIRQRQIKSLNYGPLYIQNFKTTIPSNNYDRPKTTGKCEIF